MSDPVEERLAERLRAAVNAPDLPAGVQALLEEAADDIEQYEKSFELRWNADMRAIQRWRAAQPGRNLIMPDHADLCVYLLEDRDSTIAALREIQSASSRTSYSSLTLINNMVGKLIHDQNPHD